jgi:hypothetical protein
MRGAGLGQIIKSAAFMIVYMKMKLDEMDRPFVSDSAASEGAYKTVLFCTAQYKGCLWFM